MAYVKWSAFPVASGLANTDQVVGLVGGLNKRFSRDNLLALLAGGSMQLGNANLNIYLDDAGNFLVNNLTGTLIQTDAAGNITITTDGSGVLSLQSASGSMTIDATGAASLIDGSGASAIVTYVPANPAFWAGAAPSDLASAVNRLAKAVFGLLGHAIP